MDSDGPRELPQCYKGSGTLGVCRLGTVIFRKRPVFQYYRDSARVGMKIVSVGSGQDYGGVGEMFL